MADSNFAYVELLLLANGANGSTDIRDSSNHARSVLAFDDARISTAQSKYNGASLVFDQTGGDYVKGYTGPPYAFGTGDFTVECWVFFNVVDADAVIYDGRVGTSSSATGINLSLIGGALRCDTNYAVMGGGTLVAEVWYHVALSRDSGTFRLWLNGVQVATSAASINLTDGNMSIGSHNGEVRMSGYIDEFRITKGISRYTTGFTPPGTFVDGIPAIPVATYGPRRYYRLYINSNNGHTDFVGLDGVEMSVTHGGANIALNGTGNGTGTGSSNGQGIYSPSYAFDADGATHWVATTGSTSHEWLQWDFGAGNEKEILELRIVQSAWYSLTITVGAANFQYSDDGVAWTNATIITNPATAGVLTYSWVPPVPDIGTVEISAPVPVVQVCGPGTVQLTAPSPNVASYGGSNLSLTIPSPQLHATASRSKNAALLTAPKPQISISGGGRAALTAPPPTLEFAATGTALADADITAPSPTVASEGTVSNVASISITAPGPNVKAYSGAVCSITVGRVTLQATGTGGGVATAAITVPLMQLDARGTAQSHGSALITAPMPRISTGAQAYIIAPMATLTAIGTATVVATYEAYAMNMRHSNPEANDEVTHYTNFPFTHIVRYKNSYFGANSTGLYLLEGTTDDGADIDWAFKTGMTDFDSPQQKTVTYAYFGGRLGPDATVSIYPSEPGANTYAYTTPRGQVAQNYRQPFGKGMKARYYAIGASGADTLELDTLDLTVATLSRRI